MKNIAFVIWMLGYPLSLTLEKFIAYRLTEEKAPGKEVSDIVAFIVCGIWIFVGMKLYEK